MAPARQDSLLCFRVGGSFVVSRPALKLIIWGDSDGEAQRQPFDWRQVASEFPQIDTGHALHETKVLRLHGGYRLARASVYDGPAGGDTL